MDVQLVLIKRVLRKTNMNKLKHLFLGARVLEFPDKSLRGGKKKTNQKQKNHK